MNKVAILSDSTCDLVATLLDAYRIDTIPLHVNFGESSYDDGVNITLEELYHKVEKEGNLPTTSACSYGETKSFFQRYLNDGYDIVYTGISSKMSVTFQVATLVREELDTTRIFVVDSGNLSTGIGLLLLKAARMRDEGLSAREIATQLEEIVPRVKSQFVIDTMDYLYKGGRCTAVQFAFSKVLRVKPMIVVREKTMQVGAKFIGNITKAQRGMTNMFLKDFDKIDKEFVFITHTFAYEGANYIRSLIENVAEKIEHIYETVAGCVIGSHCGKNTIGILYIMKDEMVKKVENVVD
ncbi:MAG: DegV family protein [Anaeroplasma bactoclasticum]|nr:DegV family protein [Anaeroplasma bactoclasticum]